MGPFRAASLPRGVVAFPRLGTDAQPPGPMDAAAGGPTTALKPTA